MDKDFFEFNEYNNMDVFTHWSCIHFQGLKNKQLFKYAMFTNKPWNN